MALTVLDMTLDEATLTGGAEIVEAGAGLPRRITTFANSPSFLSEDVGAGIGDRGWISTQANLSTVWDDADRLLVAGAGPYGANLIGRYSPLTSTWELGPQLGKDYAALAVLSTGEIIALAHLTADAIYIYNEEDLSVDSIVDTVQWNALATYPKWVVVRDDDTILVGFSGKEIVLHIDPIAGTLIQELDFPLASVGSGCGAVLIDDRWLAVNRGLVYIAPYVYDLDNMTGNVPEQTHRLWPGGNDAGTPFEGAGAVGGFYRDPATDLVWISHNVAEQSKPNQLTTIDGTTASAAFAQVRGSTLGNGGYMGFSEVIGGEQWFVWLEGTGVYANGTPYFNYRIRKKNTQRARWSLDVAVETYPQGLVVTGITFPGSLPEWQVPFRPSGTLDTDPFRASRFYWSKNGGSRTEITRGEVLNISLEVGDMFEFDADLLDWLPSSTAPYVGGATGEGPVVTADDPAATAYTDRWLNSQSSTVGSTNTPNGRARIIL